MNVKQIKKSRKITLAGLAVVAAFLAPKLVSADSYTVQSGDTLSEIAKTHGTTVEKIAEINKIDNIHFISVGQILELDQAKENNTQTSQAETTSASAATEVNTTSGLSTADAEAKEWIAQKESSGSYTAQNGQYYGRYQLTISYLNGDLSPENQEKVADAYVAGRYGSWSAAKNFWLANGWY